MKSFSIYFVLFTMVFISCEDSAPIVPTNNTTQYFKYSIDGVERVFDAEVESHMEVDPNNPNVFQYEFNARANTSNGDSTARIGGNFTFSTQALFMTTSNFQWGVYDYNATPLSSTFNFYFSELTPGNLFTISDNHPITCTITTHPTTTYSTNSATGFIEFSFFGSYADASNTVRNIAGEARILRGADQ